MDYSGDNGRADGLKAALEQRFSRRCRPIGFYPLPEHRVTGGEFDSRYQPVAQLGTRVGLLYVHVPFCTQRCSFCRFYPGLHSEQRAEAWLSSALAQAERWAELRRSDPAAGPIVAVFMGGGSPSSLTAGQLGRLLDGLRVRLPFDAGCEITMEWYPADHALDRFEAVLSRGVERISFGVQSFDEDVLRALGSHHSPTDSLQMLERGTAARLASFNVDLMANVPGQRLESHLDDIKTAVSAGVPNISLNPLELTPRTPLAAKAAAIGFDEIDGDKRRWLEVTRHYLHECGFQHQRARNFARPGFKHRYNAATAGVSYDLLPVGPGAYGFVGGWAVHVAPDLAQWRGLICDGFTGVTAVCVPSIAELKRSFLITSLLELGFDRAGYTAIFGTDALSEFPSLATLEALGALETADGIARLTDPAILYADEISFELYSVGQGESFASHLTSRRRDGTTQYFPVSRT